MKKRVEDWLFLAQTDIDTAEIIVNEKHLTHIAAFHCQQAVEKYFKAFLLEKDLPALKVHNLVKLYAEVKKVSKLSFDEDLLTMLSNAYVESRYPGDLGLLPHGVPPVEQIADFLKLAKEVENKVQKELM